MDTGELPCSAGGHTEIEPKEGSKLMARARWNPRQTYTKHEEWLRRRLGRRRKLFAFLRAQRHELFDDTFQAELETR